MVATGPRPVAETVREKRWTPEEYEHLGELGVFGPGDHVQLIDGVIYELSPQKSKHAAAIRKVTRALRRAFGAGYDIAMQLPLRFDVSEPEPDVSVVAGEPEDFLARHPSTAVLVVEVSDTTLRFDRHQKALAYASAGVTEYWIDNIASNQLEVHRDPSPTGYKTKFVLKEGDVISPVAGPEPTIAVADLLP